MTVAAGSTAQQLAEFLGGIAAAHSEEEAVRHAIERIAEVFEAEVCGFIENGRLAQAIGFGVGAEELDLLAVLGSAEPTVDVPGWGPSPAIALPVDAEAHSSLLLARGGDPLTAEEGSLARCMAKVFSLALRMLRTIERERSLLESLQERHRLAEHLARIERSISSRRPLQETLDEVTAGARDLFGDEVVGLRLLDEADPGLMIMVSSVGVGVPLERELHRVQVDRGVGSRAIRENRIVVQEDYQHAGEAYRQFVDAGLQSAMAAPVHTDGEVVGSLTVATFRAGRRYTVTEQQMLVTFAEHVSLALNDARAMHQLDLALDDAVQRAMHDALTGLPNRVLLRDRIVHAMARASRSDTSIALAFVDLDDFKLVNDTLGHAIGDDLLSAVARQLGDAVRPGDTAARLGGDEFAVLFEGMGTELEALEAATRLLPVLSNTIRLHGYEVMTTGSIGVAFVGPEVLDAGELLRRADVAMYQAKSAGKNRVALFEPSVHAAVTERAALVGDLRRAIEIDELGVAYQPIVRLGTGEIIGAEALVRWAHPARGELQPNDFVPLAEAHGLVDGLGRRVLRMAVREMLAWQQITPGLHLSVNLSPAQLLRHDTTGAVLDILDEEGFDPHDLTLEITESVLLHDDELIRARVRRLREAGIQIAIDDFGTGYASLAYLCRFDADVLKIDRSFVAGVDRPGGERPLVAAILGLGESLGLTLVAEGVETSGQLGALLELGCDAAQGFYFAAPETPEAFRRRLVGADAALSGPTGAAAR